MPFTLIKGRFHIRSYSPDGDSIRFEPLDAGLFDRLDGFKPKMNARGHAQLRIEAIDALETHYNPKSGGGVYHQPLRWAQAASDRLLDFAGITGVEWDEGRKTVLAAADGTPGYIMCRAVEKYGRPISFVFAGDAAEEDGASVHLDAERLRDSFNLGALAEGLAYPTYYKGLFRELRDALTEAAGRGRADGAGVYADDRTETGFDATDLGVLTRDAPVMPKLFRRLCEYMVEYGTAVGFRRKLAQAREPVLDLRTSNFTHLDSFVEQEDDDVRIRLTRRPEELVFDEMPARPANHFSALMGNEVAPPPRFVRTMTLPADAVYDVSSY